VREERLGIILSYYVFVYRLLSTEVDNFLRTNESFGMKRQAETFFCLPPFFTFMVVGEDEMTKRTGGLMSIDVNSLAEPSTGGSSLLIQLSCTYSFSTD